MQLIPALGSREMQDSLENEHVKNVVRVLLQLLDTENDFFALAAAFLRKNEYKFSPKFSEELQALKVNRLRKFNIKGESVITSHVDELCQALLAVYDAPPQVVGYRRGAIVELLTHALVSHRYQSDECKGNHRFLYPFRPFPYDSSDQVDVAVLSMRKMQIEGYSCKMQGKSLQSVDCTNLQELSYNGHGEGYVVHIGVVCFDNSKTIHRRLRDLSSPEQNLIFEGAIQPYGIDNLTVLTQSPFP